MPGSLQVLLHVLPREKAFDAGQHDHETQLPWEGVDGLPHLGGAFRRLGAVVWRRRCGGPSTELLSGAPPIGALPIQGEAPCQTHEPRPEPLAVARVPKIWGRPI